ncbi:MAG: efflux RND transporter permease subunit [Proteobacteria bacterium]|nr:efflux RND transporter permease subunit [Pseudomonadota bacterium]
MQSSQTNSNQELNDETEKGFLPSNIAIQRPSSIFILMILIFIMGLIAYRGLPREAFPEVQIPYLIVTIPYPGSSPEDVESLIVNKLESEMQNLDDLKEISSTSTEGAAMVALEYDLGADIDEAKIEVREALDRVTPELPDDTEDPIITEINTADFPIIIINLSGTIGLYALKEAAEDLKEDIEGIPGVLEVKRAGGLDREVQVNVDPDKLRYYNLDLNQVSNAIAYENTNTPAGNIEIGPLKYMIRIPGEIEAPERIDDMIITAPGQIPVFTRDVARTQFSFQEVTTRSRLNKTESVSLSVSKRSGENLLEITGEIKRIIEKAKNQNANTIKYTILSDHSDTVKMFIRDLENNMYSGLVSVLLVLIFILGFRNSVFVAAAIPFSMLISFLIIQSLGITLNMIVLFALIMALGMLVDNAIVIVENIYRHLELGYPPKIAAKLGVGEVAIPVSTSTLTTLAAFFPLLFMPGIMGDFMSYMPKMLIITLSASLFVGLVINPVLCSVFMKNPKKKKSNDEISIAEGSKILGIYRKVLQWALAHRLVVVFLVFGTWIFLFQYYAKEVSPSAGTEFFPESEPEYAIIHVEAPLGSSLERSDELTRKIEKVTESYYDKTTSVIANVGQPAGSMVTSGKTTHLSHLQVNFPNWQERTSLPSDHIVSIRSKIAAFSGAVFKITKAEHGPPTGKPVNIEISGEDLVALEKISLDIQSRIKNVEGLVNLDDNFVSNRSEIQVLIDREKTARLGLRTASVAGLLRTAFNGKIVSTYREGKEEYDIVVRLDEKHRKSINSLESLYIKTPEGQSVNLGEIAIVTNAKALGSIRHIGTDRVITVSGDAEGKSGSDVLSAVQEELKDYIIPEGFSLKYSGANTSQKEMEEFLPKSFLVTVFLIFLILVTQFNSLALPFIIVTSVFLSMMGVYLGMIIHHSPFSIMMGGIGIISLAGVVVNNAIVLIDYIQQLRAKGLARERAIVLSGMLRLRPVLLTAMTTILALIPVTVGLDIDFSRSPIVLFGSESGQMWIPMAQAVIYGLAIATGLTLIVIPVLYSLIETGRDKFAALINSKANNTLQKAG